MWGTLPVAVGQRGHLHCSSRLSHDGTRPNLATSVCAVWRTRRVGAASAVGSRAGSAGPQNRRGRVERCGQGRRERTSAHFERRCCSGCAGAGCLGPQSSSGRTARRGSERVCGGRSRHGLTATRASEGPPGRAMHTQRRMQVPRARAPSTAARARGLASFGDGSRTVKGFARQTYSVRLGSPRSSHTFPALAHLLALPPPPQSLCLSMQCPRALGLCTLCACAGHAALSPRCPRTLSAQACASRRCRVARAAPLDAALVHSGVCPVLRSSPCGVHCRWTLSCRTLVLAPSGSPQTPAQCRWTLTC